VAIYFDLPEIRVTRGAYVLVSDYLVHYWWHKLGRDASKGVLTSAIHPVVDELVPDLKLSKV